MQRNRDAALHVRHARSIAALPLPPEWARRGGSLCEYGVVVAEQRDACSARPAQRGVERETARGLHELRLEPVALGLEREQASQAVESFEVAARRVEVDPRGEVGEQEVELCPGAPVHARGLLEGDRGYF